MIGLTIAVTVGLIVFGIYKIATCEKYKRLRDIGYFPIDIIARGKRRSGADEADNKYDGHRYKQRRRYNFLSQQNRRNQ
jgi:hypothetical protein